MSLFRTGFAELSLLLLWLVFPVHCSFYHHTAWCVVKLKTFIPPAEDDAPPENHFVPDNGLGAPPPVWEQPSHGGGWAGAGQGDIGLGGQEMAEGWAGHANIGMDQEEEGQFGASQNIAN